MILHQYLDDAARKWPDKVAVQEAGGSSITYRELGGLSDRLRDRLVKLGVRPGDRVGFWIRKSIEGVATIFGALKAGAAYVPVDPSAPATRNGYILADCAVAAVVVESRFKAALLSELSGHGAQPAILAIDGTGGGVHLRAALDEEDRRAKAPPAKTTVPQPDDLAYTSAPAPAARRHADAPQRREFRGVVRRDPGPGATASPPMRSLRSFDPQYLFLGEAPTLV
jgi:acyl-CoA synthetase (AMP-forming)/AMP-acid ligase II